MSRIPLPLPKHFVLGMDAQKSEGEGISRAVLPPCHFLNGRLRSQGWWFYYFVGMGLKWPLGLWGTIIWAAVWAWRNRHGAVAEHAARPGWRFWCLILLPPFVLVIGLNSQTGVSGHFRYLLPAIPFVALASSQLGTLWTGSSSHWLKWPVIATLLSTALSVVARHPYYIGYFNELAGWPFGGHRFLLRSDVDWGQDLLALSRWSRPRIMDHHSPQKGSGVDLQCKNTGGPYGDKTADPFIGQGQLMHKEVRFTPEQNHGDRLNLAYCGLVNPALFGIDYRLPPIGRGGDEPDWTRPSPIPDDLQPGTYVISVNLVQGLPFRVLDDTARAVAVPPNAMSYFRRFIPAGRIGTSLFVYHLSRETIDRARQSP